MIEKKNTKFYILVAIVILVFLGLMWYVRFPLSNSNVARNGDTVKFTFDGKVEGETKSLKEIMDSSGKNDKWNEGQVTIGDYQEPMALEEAVVEHKRGNEIKDVKVSFGEDYSGNFAALKGKTVVLNLKITDVNRCTDGEKCYPVSYSNQRQFKKDLKEFNKAKDEANKKIDATQKSIDQKNKVNTNKNLGELQTTVTNMNKYYDDLTKTKDSMKKPDVKENAEKQLSEIEKTKKEISDKMDELSKKADELNQAK